MRRALVVMLVLVAFATGYGVTAHAYPGAPDYVYGRTENHGFFTNSNDSSGWEVLNVSCSTGGEYGPYNYNNGTNTCNAIPRDLNTAAEFIAFIKGRLANGIPNGSYGFSSGTYGDTRAKTGAALIVHTMLGTPLTPAGLRTRPPSPSQMIDWEKLVTDYASAGRINWNTSVFDYNINSLYQGTDDSPSPNDVSFYDDSKSDAAIVFLNNANLPAYAIRRACGNPMGQGAPVLPQFTITGRTTVSNSNPSPGTSITFSHYVKNEGPTSTKPNPIWWVALQTSPTAVAVGGSANSGIYAVGQETNVNNNVVNIPASAVGGTQYCQQVGWDPITPYGGRNGRGTIVCATVAQDYNLTPDANPNTSQAEAGDTVTFTYTIQNGGTSSSPSTTCTAKDGSGATVSGVTLTCGVFPAPPTVIPPVGTESIPITAAMEGTNICRTLTVTPASPTIPSKTSASKCVRIVNKPYMRAYGGDISAGNGQDDGSGTCASSANTAVVGWNRRSANGYAGAGAQFAIYALGQIQDVSTALGNNGGAPKPAGLSFANTPANVATGDFAGEFGSALPCIRDFFGMKPPLASMLSIPSSVASMGTGTYYSATGVTLGGGAIASPSGTPAGPTRITVYVDGDVFITSDITYAGTWSIANMPMFRLIVHGDIYINNDVSQLDGLYVAQKGGGIGGTIHTCTTMAAGAAGLSPHDPTWYGECDNKKLIVNGAFVADELQLGRSKGSLGTSSATESASSGNAAEAFNYSPIMWMQQPTSTTSTTGTTSNYDAVTSLPPVL